MRGLVKDEYGHVFINIDVLFRVESLILLQREFFKTRDKKTLVECKRREEGFLAWMESVKAAIVKDKCPSNNEIEEI